MPATTLDMALLNLTIYPSFIPSSDVSLPDISTGKLPEDVCPTTKNAPCKLTSNAVSVPDPPRNVDADIPN